MEILHDVYMLYGSCYANICNVYCVKGPDGLILFDTADSDADIAVIEANLRYWGLAKEPITHVFLSHKHFNHIGNGYYFQAKGAKVVAGAEDADHIETGAQDPINDSAPFPVRRYIPCRVDIRVADGNRVDAAGLQVECIHTPGHTNGSMFYRVKVHEKTLLFTGDVLSVGPECSGAKLGWEGGVEHDRRLYLQTIRQTMHIHADAILPGHFQLGLVHADAILKSMLKEAMHAWRRPMLEE